MLIRRSLVRNLGAYRSVQGEDGCRVYADIEVLEIYVLRFFHRLQISALRGLVQQPV